MTVEDLAGGRLLFERLGQVTVACLQLLEQPDVLDGDDRLVGERRDQRDLLVRERRDFLAIHRDGADGLPLTQHGDGEHGSDAQGLRGGAVRVVGLIEDVRDVDRLAVQNRPGRHAAAIRSHWPLPSQGLEADRREIVVGRDVHQGAVVPEDECEGRSAEPDSAAGDRVEDRLGVGRRAGDDAQDLPGRRLLLERRGQIVVARL